jgi:hypothetical protein
MNTKSLLLALSPALLSIACGSGGGGSQPMMCYGANLVASAVNDYQFSSTITTTPVTVKSMTNLTFDWSAVTHDFLNHPLDAVADLNLTSVMMFQIPRTEVQKKLNDDTLVQGDLYTSVPASWPPPGVSSGGKTSAMLYDFQLNGTALTMEEYNMYFDPMAFPESDYSFMSTVQTGLTLGRGFRMLQAFNLDPNASATSVAITNDSTKLTYSVNLHSLTISGVPAATPALTLDFTALQTPACLDMVDNACPDGTTPGLCTATTMQSCLKYNKNALGGDFKEQYITSWIVGHYSQTVAELEARFLDLELIATKFYRANIESGTVLDFSTLKDETGASFPGIDDSGTWLVALICGNCRNPAPWYLTILKPCTM